MSAEYFDIKDYVFDDSRIELEEIEDELYDAFVSAYGPFDQYEPLGYQTPDFETYVRSEHPDIAQRLSKAA